MEHDQITEDFIAELIAAVEVQGPLEFSVEDVRGSLIVYTMYPMEDWEIEAIWTQASTLEDSGDIMQANQPLEDVDFEEVLNIICLSIDGDSFHTNDDESLILIRGASVIVTIGEETMGVAQYAI